MNVHLVEIQGSLFQDCVSRNGTEPFRGNSGALSIAYHKEEEASSIPLYLNVSIHSCTFVNNKALLPSTNADEISQALSMSLYYGRGGGLSIITQGYHSNLQATVTNTTFEKNWADSFGGAVILLVNGVETSHNFRFEGCMFLQNAGGNIGGGIQVAFQLRNLLSEPTRVFITNSTFENNSANFGGGLGSVQVCESEGSELPLNQSIQGSEFIVQLIY